MTGSGGQLGPAMRKARTAHDGGWTRQRVAEASGWSASHISHVELGHGKPSRELVQFYDETFQANGELLRTFDKERERSTSRAARLGAATAQRVNFRTAGEVLAWLAGVVAFALVFPLWLTVAVAAVALGAGIVRAAKQRVRAASIAVPAIALVAVASYLLAGHSTGQQPASAAHEPRVRRWVSVGYGIQAALEVKDLTFRDRWGTTIEADGWDRLQFRLSVRNTNASPSPPLVVRQYVNQSGEPGEGPRFITFSFGLGADGPFTAGPRVNIVAQSNGLYKFDGSPLYYGEPSLTRPSGEPAFAGSEVEALSVALPRSPPAEQSTGEEYAIPSIPARGHLQIGFTGSYEIPRSDQLSSGKVVEIENPRGPDHGYSTTTSAAPGDTLLASGLLFDTGFRGVEVHVRLHIGAHDHGTVSRITLYASEDNGPFQDLGVGTVNAEGGVPIRLSVQPGSTEIEDVKNKCTHRKEPLPDGIAEGGIDVGTIGGWVPRDPCHSEEFNRYVLFKLDVR